MNEPRGCAPKAHKKKARMVGAGLTRTNARISRQARQHDGLCIMELISVDTQSVDGFRTNACAMVRENATQARYRLGGRA